MPYVCDEHQVAYEDDAKKAATAHFNFAHPGEQAKADEFMRDEIPEGYEVRTKAPERPARTPHAAGTDEDGGATTPRTRRPARSTGASPVLTGDAEADSLGKLLVSIGVPEHEVSVIVTGFLNIPHFREDANALAHWLDTHISDRRLKGYIPLAVNEIFANKTAAMPPFYPMPQQQQAQPQYFYGMGGGQPQQPYYAVPQGQVQPPGFVPYAMPSQPGMPYPPVYTPQAHAEPEDDSRFDAVTASLASMQQQLQEEREARQHERDEATKRDEQREIAGRFERLEVMIANAVTAKQEDGKAPDPALERLSTDLSSLREAMTNQQVVALNQRLDQMTQAINASKPDTVGRTTEDIVSEVGPVALEKVNTAGEQISKEISEFRKQVFPRNPTGATMPLIPNAPAVQPEGEDLVERVTDIRAAEDEVLGVVQSIETINQPPAAAETEEAADVALSGTPQAS